MKSTHFADRLIESCAAKGGPGCVGLDPRWEDLPEKIRAYRGDRFVVSADDPTEVVPMDEVERRYIKRVLNLVGGNKSQAAQLLGFDRRTLYRKLSRYEGAAEAEAPARTGS